jgi:hypothetical protein
MSEENLEVGNSPVSELETLKAALAAEQAKNAEVEAKNAELEEKDAQREEEKALKDKIDSEPRFKSARNTLILRTIPNPEEIVPARAVLDYLEISDKKQSVKKKDRTYISNAELKAYQALKAKGNADVTYEMVEERLAAKKTVTKANNDADDASATDSSVDNETNKSDNPSNSADDDKTDVTAKEDKPEVEMPYKD